MKNTVAKVLKLLLGAPLYFLRVIAFFSEVIVHECACRNSRFLLGLSFAAFVSVLVLTPVVPGHICFEVKSQLTRTRGHIRINNQTFLLHVSDCVCVCVYVYVYVREMIWHLQKEYFVYLKNVQDMQPEVRPFCVPPTQQAPVFPASQLNGCLEVTGGGFWGFGWGTGLKTGSPGWGMFGGA